MTIKRVFLISLVLISFLAVGCSSYSIKSGQPQGNEEAVKSKLKNFQCAFGELGERDLAWNVNSLERSIKSSGDLSPEQRMNMVASMKESMKWEEYRYFIFNIFHGETWGFGKDDFAFSMMDADGKLLKAIAVPLSYSVSGDGGSYNVHRWIIKTEIPVVKATVKSPVTVKVQLFKSYVLTYMVTPSN